MNDAPGSHHRSARVRELDGHNGKRLAEAPGPVGVALLTLHFALDANAADDYAADRLAGPPVASGLPGFLKLTRCDTGVHLFDDPCRPRDLESRHVLARSKPLRPDIENTKRLDRLRAFELPSAKRRFEVC